MVVHSPGFFVVYLRMCVGFEDAPRPDSVRLSVAAERLTGIGMGCWFMIAICFATVFKSYHFKDQDLLAFIISLK